MDRVTFLESVNGINYPDMLVQFFDHFIALKNIIEDSGAINVLESTGSNITFSVKFRNKSNRDNALNVINAAGRNVVIYQHPISIDVNFPTDSELIIRLQ
jgi:hypothetical protein